MTSDNNNDYTFWADQAANPPQTPGTSDPELAVGQEQQEYKEVPPTYTGFTNGAIPPEPPKKPKKSIVKKALTFVASAAIFGLVAGGVFLGVNKIYYYLNPDEPSSVSSVPNDRLMVPNEDRTLSSTAVADNVSITQTDVSAIIEKTMPATVEITSKFVTNNYFYGESTQEGGGSGIIIGENEKEYLIATNNHVIENASSISIAFIDGSSAEAYVKGTDPSADLAVIAVKKDSLTEKTKKSIVIATLGNSDDVKVGNMVIAIGNALGNGQSSTVGWISAKDREITNSDTGSKMVVLQTDAAINPGNSGGALLNMKGEVIGINSAKLAGTKIEGIGYAIPISKALPIVSDLMTREVLTDDEKGYLGITLSDVDITSDIASAYNWPMGVYIKSVVPGSAADKGGLIAGDIITAVNNTSVTTRKQLQETVTSHRYGTTVSITYSRFENGEYTERSTDVVLSQSSVINNSQNQNPQNGGSETVSPTPIPETPFQDKTIPEIPQDPDQYNGDNNRDPFEDFFNDFFGN